MNELKKIDKEKMLIRACHKCLKISESYQEIDRCLHCKKSFLPLRYFDKIHELKGENWKNHFADADDVAEDDLIKGLFVLW